MARGWYGLDIGDEIKYLHYEGTVTSLSILNKNKGTMRTTDGKIINITCESCKKIS